VEGQAVGAVDPFGLRGSLDKHQIVQSYLSLYLKKYVEFYHIDATVYTEYQMPNSKERADLVLVLNKNTNLGKMSYPAGTKFVWEIKPLSKSGISEAYPQLANYIKLLGGYPAAFRGDAFTKIPNLYLPSDEPNSLLITEEVSGVVYYREMCRPRGEQVKEVEQPNWGLIRTGFKLGLSIGGFVLRRLAGGEF
jgi:hypothetical protein